MADVHSKEVRSYNMSRIKGKDTKPEMLVRKYLHSLGFRYRLHDKRLPGKPDLVFPSLKTVIQVHGCFWHRHEGCKRSTVPATRTDWWKAKIGRNVANDVKNLDRLNEMGWEVMTVWECRLKPKARENTLSEIASRLKRVKKR